MTLYKKYGIKIYDSVDDFSINVNISVNFEFPIGEATVEWSDSTREDGRIEIENYGSSG